MKRLTLLLASITAMALLGIATVAYAASAAPSGATPSSIATINGDPHMQVRVSAVDAQVAVERLLPPGNHNIKYLGTKDRSGIRAHAFSGSDFNALVDVFDGHVTMLTLPVPVTPIAPVVVQNLTKSQEAARVHPTPAAPKVTSDQAKAIAIAYLASINSPTDGLTITVKNVTGSGTPGYTVSFQRYAGDIVLPDYRLVEVDGNTGTVFSLIDVRRPYVDPGAPKVNLAEAQADAVAAAGGAQGGESHLIVWFDKNGAQYLVWEVEVKPAGNVPGSALAPSPIVMIDALTGNIVDPSH